MRLRALARATLATLILTLGLRGLGISSPPLSRRPICPFRYSTLTTGRTRRPPKTRITSC